MQAATIDQAQLFNALCAQLHETPDRKGRVHITCPECGKEPKNKQVHCSFSERGWWCFVCTTGGSLAGLAKRLDVQPDGDAPRVQRHVEPAKPKQWQRKPEQFIDDYCAALDRLHHWQAYKPLTMESIARWRLGVGKLPASRCEYRRLILPVYENDKVVALHGRVFHPNDTDAKWLTAGGSTKSVLFNANLLAQNCTVIVCENMVDCILAMQETPGVVAVAGGGVAWREEWSQQIAAVRPRHVLVWLDNDEAGRTNGVTISNSLLAAGAPASFYRWPKGTPAKADLGWAFMQGRAAA